MDICVKCSHKFPSLPPSPFLLISLIKDIFKSQSHKSKTFLAGPHATATFISEYIHAGGVCKCTVLLVDPKRWLLGSPGSVEEMSQGGPEESTVLLGWRHCFPWIKGGTLSASSSSATTHLVVGSFLVFIVGPLLYRCDNSSLSSESRVNTQVT